jgi:hypothetical protein
MSSNGFSGGGPANGGQQRNTFSRLSANPIKRVEPGPDAVVHLLYQGRTPCGMPTPPSTWASNHYWTGILEDKTKVNCPVCKAWLEKDPDEGE